MRARGVRELALDEAGDPGAAGLLTAHIVDAGEEVFADAGGDQLGHGTSVYGGHIQRCGVYGHRRTSYANRAAGVYGRDRGPGACLLSHVSRSYGGQMIIEVTQILGDGSVRHAAVATAVRDDAARWEDLAERAALAYPPPYRAELGQAVYDIRVGDQVCQVGEGDLVGPLLKLVTTVLAEGGNASWGHSPGEAGGGSNSTWQMS